MKKKILVNALSSLIQVIIVTIVYFVLYKYLIDNIGIEKLGIWSLILASTSVLNISDLGFSSGVLRFIAKYISLNDRKKVIDVIQTSLITVGIIAGIVILIIIPFANYILGLIIPEKFLSLSLSILPFSLIGLWINILSGIFTATLDGLQRFDLKNIALISGSILYLGLTIILVPLYDLFGVVYAQIFQAVFVLLLSVVLVKKEFSELPLFSYKWKKDTFKEMINYSTKFQGISLIQLLYDPVTKGLLTKFGGLSATGYYEMANRLILRIRGLVLVANQVLVPAYASIAEENKAKVKNLYSTSINYVLFLTIPLFLFIIAVAPLISEIWIGRYEKYFVYFLITLCVAWGVNIVSAPAYFANLGTGDLNWNLLSHLIIGVLNLLLGIAMGYFGGALYVIFGWGISLIAGSLLIPINFHHKFGIGFSNLFSKENIRMFLYNIITVAFTWLIYNYLKSSYNIIYLSILIFLFYIFINWYFIWKHSVRIHFTSVVMEMFGKNQN